MAKVILTRPQGENEGLAARLSEFDVTILPLIKLSGTALTESMKKTATDLDLFDEIIFVSKSAVKFAMPHLESYWPQWPLKLKWLAVGVGTAQALAPFGVQASFPQTAGSEGLLALEELRKVDGHRILIARGSGGRELLATELTQRGADVHYFESYERTPVPQPLLKDIDAGSILVATSAEIMQSALEQLEGKQGKLNLVVPSERIEALAVQQGFGRVLNARGASEQALYDAVVSVGSK